METDYVRLNVTLPKLLVQMMNRMTGSRKRRLPLGSGNLPKNSKIKADQIRTIDKKRLVKRLGMLPSEDMEQINTALKLHLGLEV